MIIEAGNTFKSGSGHIVTINQICGDTVYYSDEYGCHYHKAKRHFALQYISAAAYYTLKGEPEKAEFIVR